VPAQLCHFRLAKRYPGSPIRATKYLENRWFLPKLGLMAK